MPLGGGEVFTTARCGSCGALWLRPAPEPERLARAYASDYYGEGGAKFLPWVEAVIGWFRGSRAREVAARLPAPAAVLDVGCGNGDFLGRLHRRGAYAVHGVEMPGVQADRAAAVPGVRLIRDQFRPGLYAPASMDAATLFHVIEHLAGPAEALAELARVVKPGGWLWVSLPNSESWQARICRGAWLHWDPPRHLWLAGPAAVAAAAGRVGFEHVQTRQFSLEQNPFGLLQGLLNRWFPRDRLYTWLKSSGGRRGPAPVSDLLLAAILGLPCIVFSVFESVCGRGGTVTLVFRRRVDA